MELIHRFVRRSFVSIRCLFGLLGKKNGMDVGKDTSGSNGDSTQETVEFLVILDGKGDVTRDNTALLVVTGSVSGKFLDLGTEVFKDSSKVDRGASSHSGGVLSLTQVTSDTTNRELKTGLGRCGGGLLFSTTSFSFSCGAMIVDKDAKR